MDQGDKIAITLMWLFLVISVWTVPFLIGHDLEILCGIGANP